ncbi:MAG: hypothetical protein II589_05070, partial [Clostridia bacterium]|nr:hypothetical protein [Clostridia bacterium]
MNKNLRRCPYCDSRVSYIKSLTEIGSGEHLCPACKKYSNIEYSKKIYLPAAIILVLAIALAAIFFFSDINKHLILSFIGIIIPFGIFFFMIPLFYMLKVIPSEAKTPVIKVEPEKKSKTKERKVTETKNIKEYDKPVAQKQKVSAASTQNDDTFKSKFQKFVKTYIIVDDDEDDSTNKKAVPEKSNNTNDLHETEPDIENTETAFDEDIIVDIDFEYEDISSSTEEEKKPQPVEKPVENIKPKEEIKTVKPKAADIPKVIEKTETANKPEPEKKVSEAVVTEEKAIKSQLVFHKLTKSKDIDFDYLPDYGELILVDISANEEIEQENEDDKEDEEI